MKKVITTLLTVLTIAVAGMAKDAYTRNVTVLPKAAQTVLANNFKAKVSVIKVEKELGRISDYEVILTDGSEITFDRNGNWENVEMGANKSVPKAFVPETVASYIKNNQPGQKVIGIEKDRKGYEVQLSNGVEMKFNAKGQFQRYD